MNSATKSLLKSRTFWGAILSVVGAVAGLAGYNFGPAEQEALILVGTTLTTALGSALAIYGRVKASKKIG